MLARMSRTSTRVLRVLFLCGLASVGLYGGAQPYEVFAKTLDTIIERSR